ncbi:MAG: hypothetical protein LBU83_08855 [Bacteroidales bacterium]|jgi:hypothetical protein|nr:hypothetical protein [Bacteroidales bacterium]
MQKTKIKSIIEKYKELADFSRNETKIYQYIRFAEYLDENIDLLEDDENYNSEEDFLALFNKKEAKVDDLWKPMLQVGDDEEAMAKFIEEEIYSLITNSAKEQFDYDSFEEFFLELNENIDVDVADKILWLIIMNLAGGCSPQFIANKIQAELLLTGFFISDVSILEKIITDNLFNWSKAVGIQQIVTDLLNSDFAPVKEIYYFVLDLFENNYSPKGVIVPWLLRRELDKYMDKFKHRLDTYELFFLPSNELLPQGWDALYLDCKNSDENNHSSDSILLQVYFNHSENLMLIQNVMTFGLFRLLGTRMEILSLLLDVCSAIKYRLIFVQLGDAFHEKLIKRGATYLTFEDVEITKETNLTPSPNDEY